jgi:3-hydroxyisobutyrate dehydrogenase
MAMASIAFCGLGMMGSEMAARLRSAGHGLRVWNRSSEKATAWAAAGGQVCQSPEEAARGASEAHLMLADDAAVESTLFGPSGVLAGLGTGRLVVDHSTVSVAGTRERVNRLVQGGWRYVHAPVFAGPPQVKAGEGLMLIGGATSSYEAARPTLQQIVEKHLIVSEKPEEAAAFKLMGNSMLVSIVEGLAEFFATAKANGISAERAYSLFSSFDPGGTIFRRGPRMAAGDYTATFELSMALKDTQLMLRAAGNDAAVPALAATEKKMQRLIGQGYAKLDLAVLGADAVPPRGGDGR